MNGSIRQRGTTFTAYWFTTDPATGKRCQHTKGGFHTKGAARKHLNAVVAKVDDGSWRPDKPLTVRDLLVDHWLPAQRVRGLRPATLAQYGHVVDAWLLPHVGGLRVSALTPAHVHDLVHALRTSRSSTGRDGLSPRVAQIAVGTLKAATAWALQNGLLGRDPMSGVRRPRAQAAPMTIWTDDQARSFLDATTDDRVHVAWALFLTRGPRRGEVAGMRWEDVDLDAKVWRINRTLVVADGKPVASTPKTAAGRRTIPLDDRLVALLKAHKARQASERLVAGDLYDDNGFVIADELGQPYHPETLSTWFEKWEKSLGLPRIRLHDTRHTAASLMLAAGVPVKVVSEILGHASVTITLSIYAHVLPGMAEEAGAALSASLLGDG